MAAFSLMYKTNVNSCPRLLPAVPLRLEYPEETEEQPEKCGSDPTPSTSAKTAASAKSSEKKRGQHGRHKIHDYKDRWTKRGVNWAFFKFLKQNKATLTYAILEGSIHQPAN